MTHIPFNSTVYERILKEGLSLFYTIVRVHEGIGEGEHVLQYIRRQLDGISFHSSYLYMGP